MATCQSARWPVIWSRCCSKASGLLGQDRSRSRKLAKLLSDGGVKPGAQVGVAGWKYFSAQESDTPDTWLETPAYLADTLRTLTGDPASVRNATAILMSNTGLRAINEVEQLARFEYAATFGLAGGAQRSLFNIQSGMTEYAVVELMKLNGLPLSCHLMLSAGDRARHGAAKPFQPAYRAWRSGDDGGWPLGRG